MNPQRCAQCGAMIDPLAHACPYCRYPTPAGVATRQHHHATAAAHHVAAGARLRSTSSQTLVFGLLGTLLFCTPFGIVGIVQGVRARGMAREARVPLPGVALAGLVLSVLSLFTSIGGIVLLDRSVEQDKTKAVARAAEVEKRVGRGAEAPVLTRDVACALAEAHLLREGHEKLDGWQIRDVECLGKLTSNGDRAEIDLVRVKDVTKKYELHACFKRGGTWFVTSTTTLACPR